MNEFEQFYKPLGGVFKGSDIIGYDMEMIYAGFEVSVESL